MPLCDSTETQTSEPGRMSVSPDTVMVSPSIVSPHEPLTVTATAPSFIAGGFTVPPPPQPASAITSISAAATAVILKYFFSITVPFVQYRDSVYRK